MRADQEPAQARLERERSPGQERDAEEAGDHEVRPQPPGQPAEEPPEVQPTTGRAFGGHPDPCRRGEDDGRDRRSDQQGVLPDVGKDRRRDQGHECTGRRPGRREHEVELGEVGRPRPIRREPAVERGREHRKAAQLDDQRAE